MNVFRAPTDNDREWRGTWTWGCSFDRVKIYALSTETRILSDRAEIRAEIRFTGVKNPVYVTSSVIYTVYSDGALALESKAHVGEGLDMLPRYGVRMGLPLSFDKVKYLGKGPYEGYEDTHRASLAGMYEATGDSMMTHYIRPQESGNRHGCREAVISDGERLVRVCGRSFDFSLLPYTAKQLARTPHDHDLPAPERRFLCADRRQNGIGSHSCGPELLEKYRFNEKEFTFECEFSFE